MVEKTERASDVADVILSVPVLTEIVLKSSACVGLRRTTIGFASEVNRVDDLNA